MVLRSKAPVLVIPQKSAYGYKLDRTFLRGLNKHVLGILTAINEGKTLYRLTPGAGAKQIGERGLKPTIQIEVGKEEALILKKDLANALRFAARAEIEEGNYYKFGDSLVIQRVEGSTILVTTKQRVKDKMLVELFEGLKTIKLGFAEQRYGGNEKLPERVITYISRKFVSFKERPFGRELLRELRSYDEESIMRASRSLPEVVGEVLHSYASRNLRQQLCIEIREQARYS
jgi:hypothetical protein